MRGGRLGRGQRAGHRADVDRRLGDLRLVVLALALHRAADLVAVLERHAGAHRGGGQGGDTGRALPLALQRPRGAGGLGLAALGAAAGQLGRDRRERLGGAGLLRLTAAPREREIGRGGLAWAPPGPAARGATCPATGGVAGGARAAEAPAGGLLVGHEGPPPSGTWRSGLPARAPARTSTGPA